MEYLQGEMWWEGHMVHEHSQVNSHNAFQELVLGGHICWDLQEAWEEEPQHLRNKREEGDYKG